ncbi:MAG: hypothetical protein Hals2KO_32380 [Halioglobus sp.]
MEIESPHTFWKVYFWIHLLALPPLALGGIFVFSMTSYDYFDLVTFPAILAGLYGYAYSKILGSESLWRLATLLYTGWTIFYILIVPFVLNLPKYGGPPELNWGLGFNILFAVPTCAAFYFYGFKSKELWQIQHGNTP